MSEVKNRPDLPDRLSVDTGSPHHVAAIFEHPIGIRFNGKERVDVEEYCISEGWIRVPSGRTVDRKGKPVMIKLKGKVEAFYRHADADSAASAESDASTASADAQASSNIASPPV